MEREEFYLEAYEYLKPIVARGWSSTKYLFNGGTEEDVLHALIQKFMTPDRYGKDLYSKFDENKIYGGGFKALCSRMYKNYIIDAKRTYKQTKSLDAEIEEGFTLLSTLESEPLEYLDIPPDMTYLKNQNIEMKNLVYRNNEPVMLHEFLEKVYRAGNMQDVMADIINTRNGKPVSIQSIKRILMTHKMEIYQCLGETISCT